MKFGKLFLLVLLPTLMLGFPGSGFAGTITPSDPEISIVTDVGGGLL